MILDTHAILVKDLATILVPGVELFSISHLVCTSPLKVEHAFVAVLHDHLLYTLEHGIR
ncbi:hypothetical protein NDU88_007501 [Pleurodeles waltl]|uniref:Uncharacterized protein n=1 Tax=Pleurodeles waltl TaxID=8319 RepID=A0AAV7PQ54_PLEWA|nr:hypothetical protein NDU88_007501 [Pleurodeles waltl]